MTIVAQLTNYFFGPAIHKAAIRGDINKLRELLVAGVDPNMKDQTGITPLMLAAQKGHKEIVEYLITQGADINAKTKTGFTALFNPCFQGNIELATLLISHGADVNVKDDSNPLIGYAVLKGDKEIVELLLSNGADPYATDDCGLTALNIATTRGFKEIAQLIESYGKQEK